MAMTTLNAGLSGSAARVPARAAARPQRLLAGLRALHAAESALAEALRRWPAWGVCSTST